MKREIKISCLNDGKPFDVPVRKVKHRLRTYEKMQEIDDKLKKDEAYRSTKESVFLCYYVLKNKFQDITVEKIEDELTDDELTELTRIIYNIPKEKFEKQLDKVMGGNFREK